MQHIEENNLIKSWSISLLSVSWLLYGHGLYAKPNLDMTKPNHVADLLVERGEDHDNEVPGQQDVAVLPKHSFLWGSAFVQTSRYY